MKKHWNRMFRGKIFSSLAGNTIAKGSQARVALRKKDSRAQKTTFLLRSIPQTTGDNRSSVSHRLVSSPNQGHRLSTLPPSVRRFFRLSFITSHERKPLGDITTEKARTRRKREKKREERKKRGEVGAMGIKGRRGRRGEWKKEKKEEDFCQGRKTESGAVGGARVSKNAVQAAHQRRTSGVNERAGTRLKQRAEDTATNPTTIQYIYSDGPPLPLPSRPLATASTDRAIATNPTVVSTTVTKRHDHRAIATLSSQLLSTLLADRFMLGTIVANLGCPGFQHQRWNLVLRWLTDHGPSV